MRNLIFIIILLSLFVYNEKILSNNKVNEQSEVINKVDTSNINNKDQNNDSKFIIITRDYDYEKNYFGINLNEYVLNDSDLKSNKRNLSFGKFKDILMDGKYNSSGAYYPVQFDYDQNKMYISIYRADEAEGDFNYNKILEYNLANNSIKEVISFSDYFRSWYLSSSSNKIYGFDFPSKSLISVGLDSSIIDTLFTSNTYLKEIEYHLNYDTSLDIIAIDGENGLTKFNIDFSTKKLVKTTLLSLRSFSSYRKGLVIQTYKSIKNNRELRLYDNSNLKSIPFDFINVNTFWINDFEFIVKKEDEIQKINTDLEIINSFKCKKIHVIDVTSNLIFVSYFEKDDKKIGVLNFDFQRLIEIPNIEPEKIVVIKGK